MGKRPGAVFKISMVLVQVNFSTHTINKVKENIEKINSSMIVVPSGFTSAL